MWRCDQIPTLSRYQVLRDIKMIDVGEDDSDSGSDLEGPASSKARANAGAFSNDGEGDDGGGDEASKLSTQEELSRLETLLKARGITEDEIISMLHKAAPEAKPAAASTAVAPPSGTEGTEGTGSTGGAVSATADAGQTGGAADQAAQAAAIAAAAAAERAAERAALAEDVPDAPKDVTGGGLDTSDVSVLRKQIEMLQKVAGLTDAELQWKIEAQSGDAVLIAEERVHEAENNYTKIMYEQSKFEKVAYLLKNPNIERTLKTVAKASDAAPAVAPGGPGPALAPGGKPNMNAMLGAALAKKTGGGDDDATAAKPNMNAMLGAALAKKTGGGGDDAAAAKPNMNAMLGGALAKKAGGPMGGALGGIAGGLGGLKGGLAGLGGGGGIKKGVTFAAARQKLQMRIDGEKKALESLPADKDLSVIVDALEGVMALPDAELAAGANRALKDLEKR